MAMHPGHCPGMAGMLIFGTFLPISQGFILL